MKTLRRRRDRGAVLIISVGILAVLLLVAISFARLMVVERDVSRNHREYVQARMTAESGIEHAVGWLRDERYFQPAYCPELDDPQSPWIFRNDLGDEVGAGLVDLATCKNPSFRYGPPEEYSHVVDDPAFDYPRNFYKLRVLDTASQVNLNGPERVLLKVLANLGEAIQKQALPPPQGAGKKPDWWKPSFGQVPNPFTAVTVQKIVALRATLPNAEFTSKEQIRVDKDGIEILSSRLFRLVRDYLAVRGWKNDRAIGKDGAPNFLVGNAGVATSNWFRAAVLWWRKGSTVNTLLPNLEPRYPININTAPRVVLIANLMNFSAYRRRIRAGQTGIPAAGSALPPNFTAALVDQGDNAADQVPALDYATADRLAQAIIAFRSSKSSGGPFRNWQQFRLFLRAQGYLGADPQSARERQDMIFANACPNLMSNLFNPEPQRYLRVAKDGIFGPTNEFCFGPMGYFEITSLGWVEDNTKRVLAEVELYTEVKVCHVQYRNSQRDWMTSMRSAWNATSGPEPMKNVLDSSVKNSNDTRLAGTYGDDFAAKNGNPYEGWIQPLTESVQLTGAGQSSPARVTFRGPNLPGQSFYAPYVYQMPPTLPFDAQKAPQTAGVASASGEGATLGKRSGETIFRGESLAPDGVLFSNFNDEEMSYAATGNFDALLGTISFWVKLTAGYEPPPVNRGSGYGAHEPIFYMNFLITKPGTTPAWGVTWKLERYGYVIRSTRFLWTNPVPQAYPQDLPPEVQPVQYLWTEKTFNISSPNTMWRDNEWHHIVHSWNNYTEQTLWVDSNHPAPRFVEAGVGVGDMQITPPSTPPNAKLVELASIDPQLRVFPGGFIFNRVSTGTIYRGFTDQGVNVTRIGNCKIDEIRGFNTFVPATSNPVSLLIFPSRFLTNPGSFWDGQFPIEVDGRVAEVSFTTLYPEYFGRNDFPVTKFQPDRSFWPTIYSISAGSGSFRGTDTGDPADLQAYSVQKGQNLRYRINFKCTGYDSSAPIVDDVTIYVLVSPVYFGVRQNFDR